MDMTSKLRVLMASLFLNGVLALSPLIALPSLGMCSTQLLTYREKSNDYIYFPKI